MQRLVFALSLLILSGCGNSVTQPATDDRLVELWVPELFVPVRGSNEILNPVTQLHENGELLETGEKVGTWNVTLVHEIISGEAIDITITLDDGTSYDVSFLLMDERRIRILENNSSRGPIGVYHRDGQVGGF